MAFWLALSGLVMAETAEVPHCLRPVGRSMAAEVSAAPDGEMVSLLQLTQQAQFVVSRVPCSVRHEGDLDRPIKTVLAEHPDMDPFCYFCPHANWFCGVPTMHAKRSYWLDPEVFRVTSPPYYGFKQGPLLTYNLPWAPGGTVTSYVDSSNYIYDDPYCYTLGFLKGQGNNGSQLMDYDAWGATARQACDKWQEEFHFKDEEVTVGSHARTNVVIARKISCAANYAPGVPGWTGNIDLRACEPVTRRDFILHAYAKCALGDEAHEMAFCYQRGCLLGNHIGHQEECK